MVQCTGSNVLWSNVLWSNVLWYNVLWHNVLWHNVLWDIVPEFKSLERDVLLASQPMHRKYLRVQLRSRL